MLGQYQSHSVYTKRYALWLNEKLYIAISMYKLYIVINTIWKITIARTDTTGRDLRFLEIFEIYVKLTHYRREADWQKIRLFLKVIKTDVFYMAYIACTNHPYSCGHFLRQNGD